MVAKPKLKKEHKKARMHFAFNHLDWKEEWNLVIFFDEKKFNLDGPDGCHYYFLTNIKLVTIQGGGCVMAWAGFCSTINFHTKKIMSENYINLLQDCLIPFSHDQFPDGFIFQQDIAPCNKKNIRSK
jgi:hypothetical protein